MGKNILVVTSSPRDKGNTTLLAEAFIEGAMAGGNTVEQFDVNKTDMKGCLACNNCWSNNKACVYSDEFNEFVEVMIKADVIVFASPVYWGTYPAPLKALIDKMYAFAVPWRKKDAGNKKTLLISCGDGEDERAFTTINAVHEGLSSLLKWEVLEPIEVPQLIEAGAVLKTDAIKKAKELGKGI